MLKDLWRKALEQSVTFSVNAPPPDEARLTPHLTHTGELHLEQLTLLLFERYGQSFDDGNDEGVRHMLQYAVRIQDRDVQREFLLFFLNCSPVIQNYLCAEGIVGKDHFLTTAKAARSFQPVQADETR